MTSIWAIFFMDEIGRGGGVVEGTGGCATIRRRAVGFSFHANIYFQAHFQKTFMTGV
jgi:hypothetical protein